MSVDLYFSTKEQWQNIVFKSWHSSLSLIPHKLWSGYDPGYINSPASQQHFPVLPGSVWGPDDSQWEQYRESCPGCVTSCANHSWHQDHCSQQWGSWPIKGKHKKQSWNYSFGANEKLTCLTLFFLSHMQKKIFYHLRISCLMLFYLQDA